MEQHKVEQYLQRIGVSTASNSLNDLTLLQQQHMLHVPFENLDIIAGREIKLDIEHLFEKVVSKKRGGYCFELNNLFGQLLIALGFNIQPIMGRVRLRESNFLPPRNHLAHLIFIEGKTLLADVGFGGLTTRIPLDINDSSEVSDGDGVVRIIGTENANEFMLQRKVATDWENQYSFETVIVGNKDLEIANFYMSNHPESHFVNHRFIGKFNHNGRIGLFDNAFSRREAIEVVEQREVDSSEEWLGLVNQEFALDLDFSEQEIARLLPAT